MNNIYSDKKASFFQGSSGIPTQSGFLLKKNLRPSGADRTGKGIYFLSACLALATCLWLGCPKRLYAAEKLNYLDYETALQKAKGSQQPLLIFFTSPWCYQCTEMKRKVFQDEDIISTLNEQFLLVEVDISQNAKLKEAFLINYTPTTLFLDIHGKPIIDRKGFIPPNRFRKLLRYVSEDHYQTTVFSDFQLK
jgi:thioredoxin-related protein